MGESLLPAVFAKQPHGHLPWKGPQGTFLTKTVNEGLKSGVRSPRPPAVAHRKGLPVRLFGEIHFDFYETVLVSLWGRRPVRICEIIKKLRCNRYFRPHNHSSSRDSAAPPEAACGIPYRSPRGPAKHMKAAVGPEGPTGC